MFVAGVMVVIGAWFKRYLIVTPTLLHPFLPMHDAPKSTDIISQAGKKWAIAMGSLAGALLIITLLARIFPVISIYKTLTDEHETAQK
jgi:molybdopterin-containing oxidoreductase family membrane subunit